MKNTISILLLVFSMFYLVEYEAYQWDPCTLDAQTGIGNCLAINCPPGGCVVEATQDICADIACVRNILDKKGVEHLKGVWKVRWLGTGDSPVVLVDRMKPVATYDLR
ncbi:MAG: hypothetical protein LLG97_19390 [Deltaproteobacteria bacterium]|nr:hypothetical protein [Deltaproteobacteria bacterium]